MKIEKIKNILKCELNLKEIYVNNNGKYFKIIAVSEIFSKLNRIQKEQMIYKPLMKYIKNNLIHAISVYPYSIEEWKSIKKNIFFKKNEKN
ncbi:yrbA [Wigglesworthia glossinidia endosymbiont of Glossina brevipalpis]|uniref:YrbA protein n=1 Tax=Wigglesworthia glossinidia brevipalpis TaxID=36870 RepID=Q8D2M6_WIGBR|nr:yrbA [Wigglesworthia glossinidia endosymbiont of Glossina brevipalpis]